MKPDEHILKIILVVNRFTLINEGLRRGGSVPPEPIHHWLYLTKTGRCCLYKFILFSFFPFFFNFNFFNF
jgi:hypothetical protein